MNRVVIGLQLLLAPGHRRAVNRPRDQCNTPISIPAPSRLPTLYICSWRAKYGSSQLAKRIVGRLTY
jgi:hypothetical protein